MATTFTNQASLSYNGSRTLSNVAVGVMESVLNVTKTAVEDQYSVGDTVTYVISIVNSGTEALTGLTVSDDLGAYAFSTETLQPMSYIEGSALYYTNGAQQPSPAAVTADGVSFSGISVPANGNAMLIYSAQVNSYAPPQAGSEITNTATVTGTGISDSQAQATITAEAEAQPEMIKSISPIPVAENGIVTYTVQLRNTGNTAVLPDDGAILSDTFDPILSNVTATMNGTPMTLTADYTYDQVTGEFATAAGVLEIPAATYTQDAVTGEWSITPGTATLEVTGTMAVAVEKKP